MILRVNESENVQECAVRATLAAPLQHANTELVRTSIAGQIAVNGRD